MTFTTLDRDLAVHQKLDDEPNDVGGLTAQELKEKFDEAGLAIQDYLNTVHLPEVEKALEGAVRESEGYTDQKVVAVGAGDMARAVYDTQGRREDVYRYAHDEAVRVLGSAARFGYVALGKAAGTSSNGENVYAVPADGYADPRGMWSEDKQGFVVPQGAQTFAVTLRLRWARQSFADCEVRALVNGAVVARVSGPDRNDGTYFYDTVTLPVQVKGGDLVQVLLYTEKYGSDQAQAKALFFRAEVLL